MPTSLRRRSASRTSASKVKPSDTSRLLFADKLTSGPHRGSGGRGASVANRNTVEDRNSCPGFSSVLGKLGLFGLSGKCCVSSVNASVCRYVVPDEPTTDPFRKLLV